MTAPARTARGSIGSAASVAPGATWEAVDVDPPAAEHLVFLVRSSRAATVRIDRRDGEGAWLRAVPDVAHTATNEETGIRIDAAPLGTYRLFVTNDDGVNPAAVSAVVSWPER